MARWASLIEERRRERPVLVIDAGDFSVSPETPFREVKNRYFFSAMRLLRYDAVGISGRETAAGLDVVLADARSYGIPLVNSNILTRSRKRPAATTSVIRELGGTKTLFGRRGATRIGIFSVALPGFIYRSGPNVPKTYYVVDPETAALEAVRTLRARGCTLVVAVSHLGWPASLELARDVRGIDLVLNGHRSHKATYEERIGSTAVVDTGDNEHSFTEVSVTFAGDSLLVTSADVCAIAVRNPGDPRFLELEEKYMTEMNRLTHGASARKNIR
jgi:2',3'-cyclic-nucleotide 2'-phosphodiesterase (5'-nucleotidase family)